MPLTPGLPSNDLLGGTGKRSRLGPSDTGVTSISIWTVVAGVVVIVIAAVERTMSRAQAT